MRSCKLFVFFLLTGVLSAYGQSSSSVEKRTVVPAFMSWFESDIVGKIHGRFSWQTDVQFRTSSNERYIGNGQHGNPWAHPFQVVIRPWIHYDLGNSGIKFSVSPMGYWATWNYYNGANTFEPEIRSSFQVQYSSRAGRVYLTNHLRYELRWYGEEKPASSGFHIPAGSIEKVKEITVDNIKDLDQDWCKYGEDFLRKQANNKKSFFLYYNTRAAHFDNYPNSYYEGHSASAPFMEMLLWR